MHLEIALPPWEDLHGRAVPRALHEPRDEVHGGVHSVFVAQHLLHLLGSAAHNQDAHLDQSRTPTHALLVQRTHSGRMVRCWCRCVTGHLAYPTGSYLTSSSAPPVLPSVPLVFPAAGARGGRVSGCSSYLPLASKARRPVCLEMSGRNVFERYEGPGSVQRVCRCEEVRPRPQGHEETEWARAVAT